MRFSKTLAFSMAGAAALALPSVASAAVVVDTTPGTDPYSGPTPTTDFETPAPVTGGAIRTGNVSGVAAQPFGSTGNYWTVGPTDGSPGIYDLSSYVYVNTISFIWGSVDSYNSIDFLDAAGNVIATFTGSDVNNPANGNQTSPNTNPLVTFTFTGADGYNVAAARLNSSRNAFETDNWTIVGGVPEPTTWALMILGFGAIGFSMRRRRSVAKPATMRVSYS